MTNNLESYGLINGASMVVGVRFHHERLNAKVSESYPGRFVHESSANSLPLMIGVGADVLVSSDNSVMKYPKVTDELVIKKSSKPVLAIGTRHLSIRFVRRLSLLGLQPRYFTIQLGRVGIKTLVDRVGRSGSNSDLSCCKITARYCSVAAKPCTNE